MELYQRVSYELSRHLTLSYSSSFGLNSRLFKRDIRDHVYAIYGLVRIADEIVDTYTGNDQRQLLDDLEAETYGALQRGYSPNPVVHAFAHTANRYGIDRELIAPFFASMRMDLTPKAYTSDAYTTYIHGSAEVIGLMCLRIFCLGNTQRYDTLSTGAAALGSAYQKVNFLRDVAADYTVLGRMYFPGVTYETFSEQDKALIVASIQADFSSAQSSLEKLPRNSRAAVMTSVVYYQKLLSRLNTATVATIKTKRLRIATPHKLWLLISTALKYKVLA